VQDGEWGLVLEDNGQLVILDIVGNGPNGETVALIDIAVEQ
jgi:hypothetical protein